MLCILPSECQTAGQDGWMARDSGEQEECSIPGCYCHLLSKKAHLGLTFAWNSSVLGQAHPKDLSREEQSPCLRGSLPNLFWNQQLLEGSVNWTEALTLLFVGEGPVRGGHNNVVMGPGKEKKNMLCVHSSTWRMLNKRASPSALSVSTIENQVFSL